MNYLKVACLCGSLCAFTAMAQGNPVQPEATADTTASSSPVAYVYVSSIPKNSSVSEIVGFQAAANGTLTPLPGSPFAANVASMAVNGKYLFGADRNNIDVETYRINPNGSLEWDEQTDAVKNNYKDCGSNGALFLDHTGQSLYAMQFDGSTCANNQYASFGVVNTTGALTYLGADAAGDWLYQAATFLANNKYAYSVACNGDMYWQVAGFVREANGLLNSIPNFSSKLPTPKSGDFWCPSVAAADPTNHVAIVLQPVNGNTFNPDGGAQIGSFTAAANGDLSTTNTSADMPSTQVGVPYAVSMAPSGKLLAVGGSGGLQIFNFNGANAPTKRTSNLTTDEVDQLYWDNANHLYAVSDKVGKVRVYTITPTTFSEAAGSPHLLSSTPIGLSVQPLPLP